VIKENSSSWIIAIVNAVILQDVIQKQSSKRKSFNQNDQFNQKLKSKKNNHSHKKKNDKCICEKEHSFKKCSYIVKFNRKRE
jgi:ABC-type nickel/cobalt efflux system permease component RcnA